MIDRYNLKEVLKSLGFVAESKDVYSKSFKDIDAILKVDFNKEELIYPEEKGLIINERQTCNFKSNENFVVFECVNRLFEKGYKPEHIELEPKWKIGHGASGGRADILVKDNSRKSLFIIECKTEGKEHNDAWKMMLQNGGQLFSYVQQVRSTQFVCLYSSDIVGGKVEYKNHIFTLKDNEKLLEENQDKKPFSYKDAQEVEDIFRAWKETYKQDFDTRGIFESDIQAYHIGKHKFSLNDLETVSSKDIQGKYHLLPQISLSDLGTGVSELRNKIIGRIFNEAGLIEGWGTGIRRIRNEIENMGLMPPEFKDINSFFKTIIYNEPLKESLKFDTDEKEIIAYIQKQGKASTKDLEKKLGKSKATIKRKIRNLIDNGYLIWIGKSQQDPSGYYEITGLKKFPL